MEISKNVSSAGNQQGRPDLHLCYYISGFVDGEGSFHIAVQRNPTSKIGWQVIPEFHVTQHANSKVVLELIQQTLSCGYIRPNHRLNPYDVTWVFVVRAREDLVGKIVPFFKRYKLKTTKQSDFEKFSLILEKMEQGLHRTIPGLKEILVTAFSMNANGIRRKLKLDTIFANLEPSETIRQTVLLASSSDDEDRI